jgi:hypothetical protein
MISVRSFSHGSASPSGPWPHLWCFKLRHTTLGRTPLGEWSASRIDLYLTTNNTQQTDIHTPAGFEPEIPASERPADPHLRPPGNWNRPVFTVTVAYCEVIGQDSTPKHLCFEWQLSVFESTYNWWSLFVLLLRRPGQKFAERWCVSQAFIPIVLTSVSLLYSFSSNLLKYRPYRHFYWTKAAKMLC